MNNLRTSGDLSGRQMPDSPNHRPATGNSPEAIFERLRAIRRIGPTGKTGSKPASGSRSAYMDAPLRESESDPLHVNEIPLQRTPERVQDEIRACTRANELEAHLARATSVSGYLIERDNVAYEFFRPYVRELREQAEQARARADEMGSMQGGAATSAYDVTELVEPEARRGVHEGKGDVDAGTDDVDADEQILRKKRPHCPTCSSNKMERSKRGRWQCLHCGETKPPIWKRPFWKSDMELALEDIEKRRKQARRSFLEGELWKHAARHILRDGDCTLEDVEAAQVLVGFSQSCINGWVYAELDRKLNEEARKTRFKWLMPYVEQVNAGKTMAKRRGKLLGAGVEAAIKRAPEAVPVPPEARMARMLGILRGGKP